MTFPPAANQGASISDLSVLQEVEDLAAAVAYFKESGIDTIHLMGSSMGAAVTLLYAARGDAAVQSLILIAAPVDFKNMFPEITGARGAASFAEDGMTTLDGVSIKNSFFREIAAIDMPGALRKVRVPVLAFHGGRDTVVDPRNAGILEDELSTFVKTVVIEDGDHNLTRDTGYPSHEGDDTELAYRRLLARRQRGGRTMIRLYMLIFGIIFYHRRHK